MKPIAVLGSTGSVGSRALDVVEAGKWNYDTVLLSCDVNIDLLRVQIDRFRPDTVVVSNAEDAVALRSEFPGLIVREGRNGLLQAIEEVNFEFAVNAISGIGGLAATLALIKKSNLDIALANRESLVAGGRLVMEAAKKAGVRITPINPKHSAMLQCLIGSKNSRVWQVMLTAQEGPFKDCSRERLESITVEETLPLFNKNISPKFAVGYATSMNSALDIIEAKWLFGIPYDKIDIVMHPQGIVNCLVEFDDGSILSQRSYPDIRIPISYAITYPERRNCDARRLDVSSMRNLTFDEPSREARRAIDLALNVLYECSESAKDSWAIALNAANETLTALFLSKRIRFADIVDTAERVLESHEPRRAFDVNEVIEIDRYERVRTLRLLKKEK